MYFNVIRYKQNVVKHDKTVEIICPNGTSFHQFVSHNINHDLATLDGQNTHHGLGTIAITNGKFSNCSIQWHKIPRNKVEKWLDTKSNKGINIVQNYTPNIPALTKMILQPIIQIMPWWVTITWRSLIFARSKILHFRRIYFHNLAIFNFFSDLGQN